MTREEKERGYLPVLAAVLARRTNCPSLTFVVLSFFSVCFSPWYKLIV